MATQHRSDWTRRQFVRTAGAAAFVGSSAAAVAQQSRPSSGPVPLAPPDDQPDDLKLPDPDRPRAGYAIMGLGVLALEEVLPGFADAKMSMPTALVSGHRDKALKVAREYGIPESSVYDYDTYDRIADNDAVDIVYNILPNHLHEEFTIRGLEAGKAVLCEKPMAPTLEACERMIDASEKAGKQLMIAYRLHYEPHNLRVAEMCRNQEFGPVRTFYATNSQTTTAPNIRLSNETAGGPVGDVGVYCINAARYVIGEEPVELSAFAHRPDDPNFREVPASVTWNARYPGGVLSHCGCSFDSGRSDQFRVNCDQGFIEMGPAFSYRGLKLHTHVSDESGYGETRQISYRQKSQFASEVDHFSDCILNDKPNRTPGPMGLADMRIVLAIHESMNNGGRVVKL